MKISKAFRALSSRPLKLKSGLKDRCASAKLCHRRSDLGTVREGGREEGKGSTSVFGSARWAVLKLLSFRTCSALGGTWTPSRTEEVWAPLLR